MIKLVFKISIQDYFQNLVVLSSLIIHDIFSLTFDQAFTIDFQIGEEIEPTLINHVVTTLFILGFHCLSPQFLKIDHHFQSTLHI